MNTSITGHETTDSFQSGLLLLLKMSQHGQLGVLFVTLTATLLVPKTANAGLDRWFDQVVAPTLRGEAAETLNASTPSQQNIGRSSDSSEGDKRSFDSCLLAGSLCSVVYSGADGVNLRGSPGGTKILASAYQQDAAPLRVLSDKPIYVSGVPWLEVQLNGWMASRKLSRSSPYLVRIAAGKARVNWDGGDNPKDNFISLKTAPDYSETRIAKIFFGTEVEIGSAVIQGEFEWVSAQLRGWMAATSPQGTRLLEPFSP